MMMVVVVVMLLLMLAQSGRADNCSNFARVVVDDGGIGVRSCAD